MSGKRTPIRLLTAVPICDGHDSAISTINLELIRHGMEVVYLGYHRSARDIVRAAIQEDVRAVGISSYNGGHVEFLGEVARGLRRENAGHIGIFGGGGGTITRKDAAIMQRSGVDRIFFAGTAMGEMIGFIEEKYRKPVNRKKPGEDGRLARLLSEIEVGKKVHAKKRGHVIGITGPGGAGKTTLIDELVLRFLRDFPKRRLAILSHDPSLPQSGALLGDRAAMIYSQDDRVFMRSLATRGAAGGLARRTRGCLEMLAGEFEMVLVESVGIGQEAWPFAGMPVDRTVYVMGPEYGSTLQLRKIAMLDRADIVVVNKGDLPGARAAEREVAARISGRRMIATTAGKHGDGGVDELYEAVKGKRGACKRVGWMHRELGHEGGLNTTGLYGLGETAKIGDMDYRNIITIEPDKRGGRPCIRGMRITVYDILGWLAAGMSNDEIVREYPELTLEDIRAALAFAADRGPTHVGSAA